MHDAETLISPGRQGVGKGITALLMTLLRTLVFTVPFTWLLAIRLGYGLPGVWWGMVLAGVVYTPVAYLWAVRFLGAARWPTSASPSAGDSAG